MKYKFTSSLSVDQVNQRIRAVIAENSHSVSPHLIGFVHDKKFFLRCAPRGSAQTFGAEFVGEVQGKLVSTEITGYLRHNLLNAVFITVLLIGLMAGSLSLIYENSTPISLFDGIDKVLSNNTFDVFDLLPLWSLIWISIWTLLGGVYSEICARKLLKIVMEAIEIVEFQKQRPTLYLESILSIRWVVATMSIILTAYYFFAWKV